MEYIIKTEKSEKQVRLTIPKQLAIKAGIKAGQYCKIRISVNKAIVVEALDLEKTES